MFEDIAGNVGASLPFVLIFFVFGILGLIAFLYSTRRSIFYWVGSIPAPCVFNYEGEEITYLPGGDRFRKTVENGETWLESKTFGDKFSGKHIETYVRYRLSGRKEIGEFKPLIRKGKGIWTRIRWNDLDSEAKAKLEMEDVLNARSALGMMDADNRAHIGEDFWGKYAPLIIMGIALVSAILIMAILVQFLGASLNQHISALTESTNALIKLANATTGCKPSPTPFMPPG
jgi:hypothetical protein